MGSVGSSRKYSVTFVPEPSGSSRYPQLFRVTSSVPTENSKTLLGTHFVTWHGDQYVGPTPLRLTWTLNDAPTSGPVEPRVHFPSKVSGENSPIRVMSLTRAHTFSGGASIQSETSPFTARIPAVVRTGR